MKNMQRNVEICSCHVGHVDRREYLENGCDAPAVDTVRDDPAHPRNNGCVTPKVTPKPRLGSINRAASRGAAEALIAEQQREQQRQEEAATAAKIRSAKAKQVQNSRKAMKRRDAEEEAAVQLQSERGLRLRTRETKIAKLEENVLLLSESSREDQQTFMKDHPEEFLDVFRFMLNNQRTFNQFANAPVPVHPELWTVNGLIFMDNTNLRNGKNYLFRLYTGLAQDKFSMLVSLLYAANFHEIVFHSEDRRSNLPRDRSWYDMVLFTMIYMRTDTVMELMVNLFGLAEERRGYGIVQRVVTCIAGLLASENIDLLAGNNLPPLPCFSRHEILRGVRYVVDCTELYTEAASAGADRSRQYSDYKKTTTVKVLISLNTRLDPNFVSPAYLGGTISDHEAIFRSGFVETLKRLPGDVLMDKGFRYCVQFFRNHCGVDGIIPNFVSKAAPQLTRKQLHRSQTISSARSAIERFNARFKRYRILWRRIPIKRLGLIELMIKTIIFFTLFMDPLTRLEETVEENAEEVAAALTEVASAMTRDDVDEQVADALDDALLAESFWTPAEEDEGDDDDDGKGEVETTEAVLARMVLQDEREDDNNESGGDVDNDEVGNENEIVEDDWTIENMF